VGDIETSPAKLGESCTTAFGSFPVAVKEIVAVVALLPATVGAMLGVFQVRPGAAVEPKSAVATPIAPRQRTIATAIILLRGLLIVSCIKFFSS
jgi:hypothetical protein